MTDMTPDHAEAVAETMDNVVPTHGYRLAPVVGLGGSAGAIGALQAFFRNMPPEAGQAFVVVLHLAPEHESSLPEILQQCTPMPVVQVQDRQRVEPNHVYVIPPGKALRAIDGHLALGTDALSPRGRHVAVDLFFRTLADIYGPHSAAVVLSGADGDGAIGIKRIKERGGLTLAQDPQEAEHPGMPLSAIGTGMVDWVLPVAEMPARVVEYFALEKSLRLPPEEGPEPALQADEQEAGLRDVLAFLRTRTGRDFSYYKRATVVRRIGRRMQVNGVGDLASYLGCLRTRPGEAGALLQDMLISVTNFFRDPECFAALDTHLGELFKGRGPSDSVRVWVPGCATGEEAYSLAMMLADKARDMEAPPMIQVFATDLDDEAIRTAREAKYPDTIEADVSEDRLRRYFTKEQQGYKVRREIREMVLFAQHDLLQDSPFSRLDLVSCRNLLIYLNRDAQRRAFEIFHFALRPHALLFLGSAESAEEASALFAVVDKKNRIFVQRPVPRAALPLPAGTSSLVLALEAQHHALHNVQVPSRTFDWAPGTPAVPKTPDGRSSWAELHFKLLESLAPPSILVDSEHEIKHLSPHAGRFLQFGGGEPSRSLLRAVHPALRIELRAALYQAEQTRAPASVVVTPVEIGGETLEVAIRVMPTRDLGADLLLVTLNARPVVREEPNGEAGPAEPASADPVARHLDRELERLKTHLRDTVEQYEASTEELKASNEELQAMNEELRSATEELETSREELQSINEELTTVNQELKGKVDELAHSNSDMHNLMDATAIATIFLDRELRITRYTPSAVTLFNLIATDLGRPLADLATRLDYPQLGDDANRVLERLVPIEREVGLPDGQWFLSRLLPYRTLDDHIAGVVVSFIDISERKRAEEVRLWLSAVVASSTDAIISFSMDQTIRSWNAGAERIYGLGAQQAIGQPLALLAPDRPQEYAEIMEKLRNGMPVPNFEAMQQKDGTAVHLALSVSPIRDARGEVIGGTAIVRDITQQKAAAEALRSSEERFRLVVENATEYAIFSTDLGRRVTIWNSGAQRLLGYSESEVLGQPADIIFTDEDRAAGAPQREMDTAMREGRAADDRMHQRKDGRRFWASGTMMLMRDAQGQAIGFVKILRDQTAARATQQALERSQRELMRALDENEKARAELQAADAAKDQFLAVLSHELRNPLASIDSAAALLLTPGLPVSDGDDAARVVKRQAGAMKNLLDDLLDVSRLKLGRLVLEREEVTLGSVVDAALETTRPMLEAAAHRLDIDLPPYPIVLDADALRLGQVISNLLGNAFKYTHPGGHIKLKAELVGSEAVITVSDNGMGMDPGQISRMFEMFAQAQPVADRSHGLGIGLALVKSLVEMHGGRIEASSAGPDQGSQFRVTLPGARRGTAAPAPAAQPPAREPSSSTGTRGLILIADDNLDAGWGMARLLEIAGFATTRVKGGLEAITETARQRPDVAIIDIGMPDLDGHEVARQIRQTEWGKKMVLIAATGWGQESDERDAVGAGFDAHMTKPVDLRKVRALVDELLARRRA